MGGVEMKMEGIVVNDILLVLIFFVTLRIKNKLGK